MTVFPLLATLFLASPIARTGPAMRLAQTGHRAGAPVPHTALAAAVLSTVLALFAAPAMACTCGPSYERLLPIKKLPNCAFDRAGRGPYGFGYAKEAQKIGGGLVAQSIHFGGCCNHKNALLVTDCGRSEAALFYGNSGPLSAVGIEGFTFSSIEYIQPPHGPIALTSKSTIPGLIAKAKKGNVYWSGDVAVLWKRQGSLPPNIKRFDPYCGCKLHYPETPGAKQ